MLTTIGSIVRYNKEKYSVQGLTRSCTLRIVPTESEGEMLSVKFSDIRIIELAPVSNIRENMATLETINGSRFGKIVGTQVMAEIRDNKATATYIDIDDFSYWSNFTKLIFDFVGNVIAVNVPVLTAPTTESKVKFAVNGVVFPIETLVINGQEYNPHEVTFYRPSPVITSQGDRVYFGSKLEAHTTTGKIFRGKMVDFKNENIILETVEGIKQSLPLAGLRYLIFDV